MSHANEVPSESSGNANDNLYVCRVHLLIRSGMAAVTAYSIGERVVACWKYRGTIVSIWKARYRVKWPGGEAWFDVNQIEKDG